MLELFMRAVLRYHLGCDPATLAPDELVALFALCPAHSFEDWLGRVRGNTTGAETQAQEPAIDQGKVNAEAVAAIKAGKLPGITVKPKAP